LRGYSVNQKYAGGAPGIGAQNIHKPRPNVINSARMFTDTLFDDCEVEDTNQQGIRRQFIPCVAPADHRNENNIADKNYGLVEGLLNPKGKNPGDVWHISSHAHTAPVQYRRIHFATFPGKLVLPMITAGCPKDGIVLDPFCGIGTACAVAKQLGRRYIGIDINPNFCEAARKLLSDTCMQPVLLDSPD